MNKICYLFCFFWGALAPLYPNNCSNIDLEIDLHQAIIEIKKVEIPGHPYAFNPSIVRWHDRLLMSFREIIENPVESFPCCARSRISLVWLDEACNPVGEVSSFSFFSPQSHVQDPRLVVVDDELYMVYSDYVTEEPSWGSMRMWTAKLSFDGERLTMANPQPWISFYGELSYRAEKNWIPFEYKKRLLFAYSLAPHVIFEPLWNSGFCSLVGLTETDVIWPWGELRGGTPAIEIDGSYLSFFHSSIDMVSTHSGGRPALHYFMGAYRFSKRPPFQITHISRTPIIGRGFYYGASYEYYWKPVCVIFPCGISADENTVWVSYGRQDHECWVVKFDRERLLNDLLPIDAGCR